MSYSILNLKQDLTGILHGTSLDQIINPDGLIYRAGRKVLADIDLQETKRIIPLVNPIYNSVYDYACPVDVKGIKIIDIRPQVNRSNYDNMSQSYSKDFDIQKGNTKGESFNVDFNSMIKTLRIQNTFLPQGTVLNEADSVTGNGIWVASGDANTLTTDNINYASGSGSLNFNLAASGSQGLLTVTNIAAQDLTTFLNQGTFFIYVYLPKAANFSSITLKIGSSASAYYQVTTLVTQQNTVFQDGWNLLAFPWFGATVVGVPDVTKIQYIQIAYNYNGTAMNGVRLDNVTCKLGTIFNIAYYSKFIFRDAITGAFQETVTDDSNLVNLDTESYNILLYQLAYLAAQQQQGINASYFDASFFENAYEELKATYRSVYKSEYQKPRQAWYKPTNNNYNQWANERFVR